MLGGIALTGITGNGTWAYSLDGTTFTAVGTVSAIRRCCCPATPELRYTPDGTDSETATITYRAWDPTSGTGRRTSIYRNGHGGTTAFSAAPTPPRSP